MRKRHLSSIAIACLTAAGTLGIAAPAPVAVAATSVAAPAARPFDFNGDGHRDTVLGSPYGTANAKKNAGFVTVVYGTSSLNRQMLSQSSANVPGASETGDNFGYGIGSTDLDKDGFADLFVGASGEDIPEGADAGMIWVFWGSETGLADAVNMAEPEAPGASHRFGAQITTGNYNGSDGEPFVVVSAPGSGFIWDFKYGAEKRARRDVEKVGKHALRAGKANREADSFSAIYLATGDINGDKIDDLVYGLRDESPVDYSAGVLLGAATDHFKDDHGGSSVDSISSVSAGDIDGDGDDEVVVGSPGDGAAKGGHVTVFKGGAEKISPANSSSISQDTEGVPGTGETGDKFGYSVSVRDIGEGDEAADLAIGSPGEDLGSKADAGLVFVALSGKPYAQGKSISQDAGGVPGLAEADDRFGWEVTVDNDLASDSKGRLLIGAPHENGTEGAYWGFPSTSFGDAFTDVLNHGAADLGVANRGAQIGVRTARS